MKKIKTTTPEQGRRLVQLGLGVDTADMLWLTTTPMIKHGSLLLPDPNKAPWTELVMDSQPNSRVGLYKKEYEPAWTMGALYDVIPDDQMVVLRRYKHGNIMAKYAPNIELWDRPDAMTLLYDLVCELLIKGIIKPTK